MGVERLQDISRDQTVIDTGVFILLQLRELLLSDIHLEGDGISN